MLLRVISAMLFALLSLSVMAGEPAGSCAPGETCYVLCPAARNAEAYGNMAEGLRFLFNGNDSWMFATALDLRQDFTLTPSARDGLQRLQRAFAEQGTQVVLAWIPPRGLVHSDKFSHPGYDARKALASYRKGAEQLRQLGFIVPDFSAWVPDRKGGFYQRRDHHWSTQGARATAGAVAAAVKEVPGLRNLPPGNFVTERAGISGNYGTLATVAGRICDVRYPRQYQPIFSTVEKADGATAPFGDAGSSSASVMLIGTSNSKGKIDYNFGGFLQELLGTRVSNRAMRGGGFGGALEQVLTDGTWRQGRPRLLVWELPANYDLDVPVFYRQVIPGLRGGCLGEQLLSGSASVDGMLDADVLQNGVGGVVSALVSRSTTLQFTFADLSVNEFFVHTRFLSGEEEQVKVERHPYVHHSGVFWLDLPADGPHAQDTVYSVSVKLARPTQPKTDVRVEACRHGDV